MDTAHMYLKLKMYTHKSPGRVLCRVCDYSLHDVSARLDPSSSDIDLFKSYDLFTTPQLRLSERSHLLKKMSSIFAKTSQT